jgi:Tol biopolymer transport system component
MPNQTPSRHATLTWSAAAALVLFATLLLPTTAAEAAPRAPLVLAEPDFAGATSGERNMARKMARLIASDLRRSGRFVLVGLATAPAANDVKPDFAVWTALKTQGLVTGRVVIERETLRSEFRLWDVAKGEQVMAKSYSGTLRGWRHAAHATADSIYNMVTGE